MANYAYEMMLILTPQISEKEENVILEKVKKTLSATKSFTSASLGIKAFAYPIKKNLQGKYFTLMFEAQGTDLKTIGTQFKNNDKVLRYLVVKNDNHVSRADKQADTVDKKVTRKVG